MVNVVNIPFVPWIRHGKRFPKGPWYPCIPSFITHCRQGDDNLDADISDLALSKQTLIWNRALKWFLQFVSTPCFANLKPGLRCLHIVGYSILSRINGRCKSDNMVQLWRYFHPPGAVKTRRDLKAPWTLSSKISAGGG